MATAIPSNTFEDLSGVANGTFDNPYDALIESALHDPVRSVMHTFPMVVANNMLANIQAKYNVHRTTRNSQQKTKLVDPEFSGVVVDPILQRIQDPAIEPGYADPRHCLVFWARPSQKVKSLILEVQQRLLAASPSKSCNARGLLQDIRMSVRVYPILEASTVCMGSVEAVNR